MKKWLEGFEKRVSPPDVNDYVIKDFKKNCSVLPYTEQQKILKLKKRYFGKYIPETELILHSATDERRYSIRQKFIKGKELRELNIYELPNKTLYQLLDLIHWYLLFSKEQNIQIDITGCQFLMAEQSLMRRLKNFMLIYQNFLTSSNIIISEQGAVFMIDVCESENGQKSLKRKIKNFFAKPFIKHTLYKIKKQIINKEKQIIKTQEDLSSTLSQEKKLTP